jgi:hypothetical protein
MLYAIGASIAAGNNVDAQFVSLDQGCGVLVENSFQLDNDFSIPSRQIGVINLLLNRREGWHPRDLPVPHFEQLIGADKEPVLNGIDAAVNGTLNTSIS